MQTGIKAIDSLIPIGQVNVNLIIGDRQTGRNIGNSRYNNKSKRNKQFR